MLYMAFYYGFEPFLIHLLLIGFKATLEISLPLSFPSLALNAHFKGIKQEVGYFSVEKKDKNLYSFT